LLLALSAQYLLTNTTDYPSKAKEINVLIYVINLNVKRTKYKKHETSNKCMLVLNNSFQFFCRNNDLGSSQGSATYDYWFIYEAEQQKYSGV